MDEQDNTDTTLIYKLGFMEFLLETDPEIKQRFVQFVMAFHEQQLDQLIVLNEARRLINDTNNPDS